MGPEDLTQATYNQIAHDYSQRTEFPEFRNFIREAAERFMAGLPAQGKILIIGSGDGRDAPLFIKYGYAVTLLDYSENMLRVARSKFPYINLIKQDFRRLQLGEDTYDGIWASTCLYHVRKKYMPKLMVNLKKALRKGGTLYFNLKQGEGEQLIENPISYPSGGSRFYAYYKPCELGWLMELFTNVSIRKTTLPLDLTYLEYLIVKI